MLNTVVTLNSVGFAVAFTCRTMAEDVAFSLGVFASLVLVGLRLGTDFTFEVALNSGGLAVAFPTKGEDVAFCFGVFASLVLS
jgi:hypothetical protein